MPTTLIQAGTSLVARSIGTRTDLSAVAMPDVTAEEDRFPHIVYGEGYLDLDGATPNAFQVNLQTPGTGRVVRIGSGTAKADYAVVKGNDAGQGHYIVRHEVGSFDITLATGLAGGSRTDEVYLYVPDAAYDTTTQRIAGRFAVRQGDVGGANPGPDGTWDAYLLLRRYTVPQNATNLVIGNQQAEDAINGPRKRSVARVRDFLAVPRVGGVDLALGTHTHTYGAARLTQTSAFAVAHGVRTRAGYNTTTFQRGVVTATTGSGAQLTLGSVGLYMVGTGVVWYANATGTRMLELILNDGGAVIVGKDEQSGTSGVNLSGTNVSTVVLTTSPSATLYAEVIQGSGGSLSYGAAGDNFLYAVYLGP